MVTRAPVSVYRPLVVPDDHAPAKATAAAVRIRRPVRVEVRRRRTLAALGGSGALLAALAASGLEVLWWAVLAVVLVAGAYAALVLRLRRVSAEREMDAAFAPVLSLRPEAPEWEQFGRYLASAEEDRTAPPVTVGVRNRDLAAFVASWALGVALTPIVTAYRLAGGDLSDLERNGFMDRLARLQAQGRSQSVKVLAAGVVATAGVGTTAALITATPAGAAVTAGRTYTVASGDTLGAIAATHGTTVSTLAGLNHLRHPNLLMVGQVLTLPTPGSTGRSETTSAGSVPAGTYTVVAGDTLGAIAATHGTTVSALAAINHLEDPNLILVGQVLELRGAVTAAAQEPVAASRSTTAASAATTGSTGVPTSSAAADSSAVSTAAPSAAAATAVRVARQELGVPYVWGGASPSGFDCSGLVMYAYAAAGVSLPHYTVSQYDDTTRITEAELEPGDLVFYDTGDGAQPGHVTLYIGDGEVISANEPGTVVQIQPLSWDGTILGFGRVG